MSESKMPSAEEAEELFTVTVVRGIIGWDTIRSFRHVAEAGLPHAATVVSTEHEAMLQSFTKHKEAFLGGRPFDLLRGDLTRQTLEGAQASVDAASLVFMHSIVDDAALNYCRVTALMKPEDWEHWVEDKKFGLKELREHGYKALLKGALERRLKELKGESIMEKAEMLFRLCKPPRGFRPVENYVYDRNRISDLDERRHKIIHADELGTSLPSAEEDLKYLLNTLHYFYSIVSKAYGLQVPKSLTESAWG
jgi:hypothetical protein